MRRIAVIGLGRFGMAVVEQLAASGAQVIAVDSDRELVDEVKHRVDVAVALDSTDERALRSQEIQQQTLHTQMEQNQLDDFNAEAVARMPGVLRVVRDGNLLAVVAQGEWQAVQAQRVGADHVENLRPGPRLPDAEVLFAQRGAGALRRGMAEQQIGRASCRERV